MVRRIPKECYLRPQSKDAQVIGGFGCFVFDFFGDFYSIDFSPGKYRIELFGASGGYSTYRTTSFPGRGGYVSGEIYFNETKRLYLYIGGKGGNGSAIERYKGGTAGYNGGVCGADDKGDNDCPSGGSGGSTDLRTSNGTWDDFNGQLNRIIVAGGGGSNGCFTASGDGGNGGGIEGEDGDSVIKQNYKIEGGKGGSVSTIFGHGTIGECNTAQRGECGGSGGGGYFGGEGGKSGCNDCSASGGGGGSSFISGINGFKAVNSSGSVTDSSLHFSLISFMHGKTIPGVNEGNGYAIIHCLSNQITCKINHNESFKCSIIIMILISY